MAAEAAAPAGWDVGPITHAVQCWSDADLAALAKCEDDVLECSGSVRDFLANTCLKRALLPEDMDEVHKGARGRQKMELLLFYLRKRKAGFEALLDTLKAQDFWRVARGIEDARERLLLAQFHAATLGGAWANALEGRWLSPVYKYHEWDGVGVVEGEDEEATDTNCGGDSTERPPEPIVDRLGPVRDLATWLH